MINNIFQAKKFSNQQKGFLNRRNKFSNQQSNKLSSQQKKFLNQQKSFRNQEINKFSHQKLDSNKSHNFQNSYVFGKSSKMINLATFQKSYDSSQNSRAAKFNALQKFYGSNNRITKFIIPGPARGKGRPRMVMRENFNHVYTPKSTVDYQKRVAQCYVDAGGKFFGSNCKILIWITVCVRNTKLKSFKKIKEFRPIKRPDLDNVAKIILDSLTGIAYGDDAQVVSLMVSRIFDKENEVFVSIKNSDDKEFSSNSL